MRIVIVHGSNDNYGASRVLLQEVACLLALGHSVHVLVPTHGPLDTAIPALGSAAQIDVQKDLAILRRSALSDALRKPRLPTIAREADLVVLWTLATAGYIPLLRLKKIRFYVAVHELLLDRKARLLFRVLLRGKFPLTACSKATANWLCSLGIRKSRISVTYPVLDHAGKPKRDVCSAAEHKSPDSLFTVAVVGRINGHKGHLEVAQAFQESSMRDNNWRLILAGAPFPGQESALEDLMMVAERDSRIKYVGELASMNDLPEDVDLVAVFPSKAEPFGLVPIEAWSCGIRSIGYGDGGAAEVLPMVGAIAVSRGSSPSGEIADALVAARASWGEYPGLTNEDQVTGVLSADNRTRRLVHVLNSLDHRASHDSP